MKSYGLDGVPSLNPTFTDQSLDPLKRKEREALQMAQVLKGLATQRQEQEQRKNRDARKQDFLKKRGRPAPALTPGRGFAHKHRVEAAAYQDDLTLERKQAQKKAHTIAKQAAKRAAQPNREERKAAFIAERTGQPAPSQSRSHAPSQATSHSAVAKRFTQERANSLSCTMARAAHDKSPPAPIQPVVTRTSFARTMDR